MGCLVSGLLGLVTALVLAVPPVGVALHRKHAVPHVPEYGARVYGDGLDLSTALCVFRGVEDRWSARTGDRERAHKALSAVTIHMRDHSLDAFGNEGEQYAGLRRGDRIDISRHTRWGVANTLAHELTHVLSDEFLGDGDRYHQDPRSWVDANEAADEC